MSENGHIVRFCIQNGWELYGWAIFKFIHYFSVIGFLKTLECIGDVVSSERCIADNSERCSSCYLDGNFY